MARDYAREYAMYHSREEQKRRRAMRNAARREMIRELGDAAVRGKDVDHIRPLDSGGSNAKSNLRLASPSANRGWRRSRRGPTYG